VDAVEHAPADTAFVLLVAGTPRAVFVLLVAGTS
jgi:hypothetical protein